MNGPHEIRSKLFLGDKFHYRDEALLKTIGVTHVLSCVNGSGKRGGMTLARVPMSDYGNSDLVETIFPDAFEFLKTALADLQHKVLVHCESGINRSATVVVGWLMFCECLPLKLAHAAVTEQRGICIHDGYMKQLREYDRRLFGKFSTAEGELPTTSSEIARVLAQIEAEKGIDGLPQVGIS